MNGSSVKQRPLPTRLRATRILLRQWRVTLLHSEKTCGPGPTAGKVSPDVAHELARFDEAHGAITEALRLLGSRG